MNRILAFDMLLKTMYNNIDSFETRVLFSTGLKLTYLFELRFYVPVYLGHFGDGASDFMAHIVVICIPILWDFYPTLR